MVRNGYLPERQIQTGIGSIPVRQPRVRDQRVRAEDRFTSQILPPYFRRTKSIEELLPWLYLKGVSTGNRRTIRLGVNGAWRTALRWCAPQLDWIPPLRRVAP